MEAPGEPPWHCLPDLVLVKLFSYLGRRERLAAGLMCRRWLAALSAAPLWRCVRVVLRARPARPASSALSSRSREELLQDLHEERTAVAVLASRRYGPLVRRLELRWARPVVVRTAGHHGGSQYTLAPTLHLLEALRTAGQAGHLQLSHLQLHDLVMSYKSATQRGHLIAALATFLGSQRQLQSLSLQNACLGVSEALRLLGAVARYSAPSLRDLRLHAAFREWQVPHASPRFCRLLRRLGPLTSLGLDFPALSDATLRLLADAAGPRAGLRTLSVCVRSTDSRQHVLSEDAWRQLTAACPHLQVNLNIENLSHHEDIRGLLLPGVPLTVFRLHSGPVWDQSRSRDFRATLRLLIGHYAQSLQSVQLQLKNSREQLDDLVLELLSRCTRLTTFQFDGVIRNLDTVRDICRLRLRALLNFQAIHVRPKISNRSICASAKDITAAYKEALAEKDVDFRIEVPTR